MAIYFSRYVHIKSMKMLNLYYHELWPKVEEHEENKYLMVDDYMADKVLDKIKEIIGIEEFDNTKIFIDTYDGFTRTLTIH